LDQSDSDLATIMGHDTDSFNKWDAGNRLSSRIILDLAKMSVEEIKASAIPPHFISAVKAILTSCTVNFKFYSS